MMLGRDRTLAKGEGEKSSLTLDEAELFRSEKKKRTVKCKNKSKNKRAGHPNRPD